MALPLFVCSDGSTGGGLLWIMEALERLEELGVSSRLLQAILQIVVQPHEVTQVDWFVLWVNSAPLDALQRDHTPKPCCVSSNTAHSYIHIEIPILPWCPGDSRAQNPRMYISGRTQMCLLHRSLRRYPGRGGRIWLRPIQPGCYLPSRLQTASARHGYLQPHLHSQVLSPPAPWALAPNPRQPQPSAITTEHQQRQLAK